MTITFDCSCGRRLAAADENAGQRIRCGACGGIQTVPASEAAPRWVAEPATMIRFDCTDCGQTCQARPEHAGRKTRCPRCDRILAIPGARAGAELEEVSARASDALQTERPLPQPLGRARFGDEERDGGEDDLPRRPRSIRKKSRKWLWLSLSAAALILCGGGLALWLLLRTTSGDFDLVPRDAQAFVTLRVADLAKAPLGKKAMDKFQQELARPLQELQNRTGLALADIERVTVVFVDIKEQVLWIIVQTSKPLDRAKILEVAENPTEQNYQGKRYYVKRDVALAFVSSRLLVLGPEKGIQRCLGLPKKPKSGPLDDALRAASKGKVQFAAGGSLPADLGGQLKTSLEQLPGAKMWVDKFGVLFDLRTAHMTAAVGDDIDWEVVLAFPDSAKAKKAEEAINEALSMVRFLLPFSRAALQQQQGLAAKEVDEAIAQAQKSLEQMKPKQSGKTVSLSWKDNGSQFLKGLDRAKQQFNQLPWGGGFGGPPGQGFAPPPRMPGIPPRPFPGRKDRRR